MGFVFQQTDAAAVDGSIQACSTAALNGAATTATQMTRGGTPGTTAYVITNNSQTGELSSVMWETAAGEPGLTNWQAGTWTLNLDITSPQGLFTWTRSYVCRVNAAGTSQATVASLIGQSIILGTVGTKTMSLTGSQQTALASDRVYIVLVFNCSTASLRQFSFKSDLTVASPLTGIQVPPPNYTVRKSGVIVAGRVPL